MSLQKELGLKQPVASLPHEALLAIVLTGSLLAKEGYDLLRPLGLTDSQFNVLMLLAHQSRDGALSQSDLVRMLIVNRSNVTGLIDRLEQAGLVARQSDVSDRRVKRIRLTPAGSVLLRQAEAVYYPHVTAAMQRLSPADCRELCRLLERVRLGLGRSNAS